MFSVRKVAASVAIFAGMTCLVCLSSIILYIQCALFKYRLFNCEIARVRTLWLAAAASYLPCHSSSIRAGVECFCQSVGGWVRPHPVWRGYLGCCQIGLSVSNRAEIESWEMLWGARHTWKMKLIPEDLQCARGLLNTALCLCVCVLIRPAGCPPQRSGSVYSWVLKLKRILMTWECALVRVGVSEQRPLFLKESTEARITCLNEKLFVGGRMSSKGERCVEGTGPLHVFLQTLLFTEQCPCDHIVTVTWQTWVSCLDV